MSADPVRLGPAGEQLADVRLVELEDRTREEALSEILFERGRAAGRREQEAQSHTGAALALETAAAELESLREEACAKIAHTSVELALSIARRLLLREVQSGNYDIEQMVREALHAASAGRSQCVVHVNPADAETLADATFRSGTSIQADVGVGRGDVQVECRSGLMVRELEGALESIGERLLEELA